MRDFSPKGVAGILSTKALALLVLVASDNANAEKPPVARWEAKLEQSYRHYEERTFVAPSDHAFVEMRLGECWMAQRFSESPKRGTDAITLVKQLFSVGLKTQERAFPNVSIDFYELRRQADLDVLETGCWPSNQAMVQVRGGNQLARMTHTCRGKSYFRYDSADFLRALEDIGFPIVDIFVTPCGSSSERVTKEQVYERGEAKRSVWKKREPANRNAIKSAPTQSIPVLP